MAIVREIRHRWGGVIRVDDSCYAGIPRDEIERRRRETARTAGAILIKSMEVQGHDTEGTAECGETGDTDTAILSGVQEQRVVHKRRDRLLSRHL